MTWRNIRSKRGHLVIVPIPNYHHQPAMNLPLMRPAQWQLHVWEHLEWAIDVYYGVVRTWWPHCTRSLSINALSSWTTTHSHRASWENFIDTGLCKISPTEWYITSIIMAKTIILLFYFGRGIRPLLNAVTKQRRAHSNQWWGVTLISNYYPS
jgi:hypothetical protein